MNDLISRQDAIDEANAWFLDCFKVQKQDRACGLIRRLEDLPTADVAPVVHGEWMEDSEGEIYCSKCGKHTYDRHDEVIEFNGTTIIAYSYPHYCGNCGADMRGENDDARY